MPPLLPQRELVKAKKKNIRSGSGTKTALLTETENRKPYKNAANGSAQHSTTRHSIAQHRMKPIVYRNALLKNPVESSDPGLILAIDKLFTIDFWHAALNSHQH